jgi:rubrerythrin
MVTFVGTQVSFADSIRELIELDNAAVEAYEAAIDRLENITYKRKLEEFRDDHNRHIRELSDLLKKHSESLPSMGSVKELLTKGKVIIANLVGDKAVLMAMASNEVDTNTAYERMNSREDKWVDAIDILKKGLADEKRHAAWLNNES